MSTESAVSADSAVFTAFELDYLAHQRLARLATAQPNGRLQINPVGYAVDVARGTLDIGGYAMASTRKYRNVADNGRVALVVDDIVSSDPWRVRFLEIRGYAETSTTSAGDPVVRIHPARILTFALHPDDRDADPRTLRVRSRSATTEADR